MRLYDIFFSTDDTIPQITQIAARKNGEDIFMQYVLPTCAISSESTRVTNLKIKDGRLFHATVEKSTVGIKIEYNG